MPRGGAKRNGVEREEAIPRLRADLEVQARGPGVVDVRDPFLLQIYSLDADDFDLARRFDGSGPLELSRRLRQEKPGVTPARVRSVAREYTELMLLDRPEVWEAEPNKENVAPYSQIHTRKRLKVLPAADEGARWTCHGCGNCCHGLAVELSPAEEARIELGLYRDILGDAHFAEDSFVNPDEPAKRTLRQREEDGMACIFLAADGRCWVHARQGMEAKPDACQIFPAMVMQVPGGGAPRLGIRTNCGSMYQSYADGPPVAAMAPHVQRIIARTEAHRAPERVRFLGRTIGVRRLDQACRAVKERLGEGVTGEAILALDRQLLGGRVKQSARRYAANILAYVEKEQSGPAPVEEGAYGQQLKRLSRGKAALSAMAAGEPAPELSPAARHFLGQQIGHVMYLLGPLNLPDAGYGLAGILLGLLAALHATGPRGNLKTANTAFEVFMGPILETLEHSWPVLDALDARYSERLRAEL